MARDIAALAQSLLVPALVLGRDGNPLVLNSALAQLLGDARDQIARPEIVQQALSAGIGVPVEVVVTEGGADRYFSLTLARQSRRSLLFIATEITALRQTMNSLSETSKRYLDMATAGSDTLHESEFWEDGRGVLRIWQARRANGEIESREMTANWPDDIVDSSYMTEDIAAKLQLLREHKPCRDLVYKFRRKDGREHYVRASAVPFTDREGHFKGYRGISIDVTKQVLAERALSESEARLARNERHLARAQRVSGTGSFERDLVTGAVAWSEGMYEFFGIEPSAFDPSQTDDIMARVHKDDREEFANYVANVRAGKVPPPYEFRVVKPDGRVVILAHDTEIIRDQAGKPVRSVGIVKDVTEMRTRIAELEAARTQLERQGEALSAAARQLALARDAAEDANRAKSAFLAHMSHELRTPLNAIIGFAEMISGGYGGPLSDRYKGYGADIHASGMHLLNLISQILDLSKVEAGRMELDEREICPHTVAGDCLRLLEGTAAVAGVALEVEIPPSLPGLKADEVKFKQILLNLASNAIKFTPAGGTVHISAWVAEPGFVLQVRDTGAGMHPDHIPQAFEPFRQVDPGKRRHAQGTGLGLPIAKAFAELHGGSLAIESELERGTTVTVIFPSERILFRHSRTLDGGQLSEKAL